MRQPMTDRRRTMIHAAKLFASRAGMLGAALILAAGCASDQPPTPQRAQMAIQEPTVDQSKPLPPPAREDLYPAPPFEDPPLVSQQLPEEQAFVNAYDAVGKPRIVVFVNRAPGIRGNAPVQGDEVQASSVDYGAVENILSDWLSADGRVSILSPAVGQQQLNAEQTRELQSTRADAGRDVARQVAAPVLIEVRAQPTTQTLNGVQVRIVGEAIDLQHGGESLARAVVDVPPPLDKVQINKYTRFLARKLMDGMIVRWQAVSAGEAKNGK